ncbi:hypothetical protein DICPUDRAFT_81322 [Dictyostelium purpureum]|uniref:Transmembrane protein n=1 Tax=Dictyostelium purpureum TaxID=5786 RepID=F0ZT52_DICPU|nr:uncharacterized protein DICPUDRAFT_81322 [Dictyostelium purpureum]EGC32881.1 hypothetical protein DICPUDRAFT_81322 [Dictyostelium purpureum]|eukprot:XP_003290600.1 hypothetical protein DICPUDRAFT_81322 [Dictyostelium purpureum]
MFENSWCYLLCILFSILFYIVSTLYRFFSGSLIRFYENKLNSLIIGFEKILNDIKVETDFETILKYENILKKKKCNNRVQQENLKPQQLQQPQQPGKSQLPQQPEKPQIINQNVLKLQKTPQNSKNKWWFDQIIEFLISFGSTSESPLVCKMVMYLVLRSQALNQNVKEKKNYYDNDNDSNSDSDSNAYIPDEYLINNNYSFDISNSEESVDYM